MKILVSAALLLTASTPALGAAASENASAEPRRERRICRTLPGPAHASQTRMQRNRLCLTEAQWRSRMDPDLDEALDILETRSAPPPSTTYRGGLGGGPN